MLSDMLQVCCIWQVGWSSGDLFQAIHGLIYPCRQKLPDVRKAVSFLAREEQQQTIYDDRAEGRSRALGSADFLG